MAFQGTTDPGVAFDAVDVDPSETAGELIYTAQSLLEILLGRSIGS